ncbi:unnamed protein product, partial [Symbiodinium necroappetens]
AGKVMDSLTKPRRFKEADILEERKNKCEAAFLLADRKKLALLEKSKFKQYLLVLKDETKLFPLTLQIQCTQRMLADLLSEVCSMEDTAQAVAQMEQWTQLLFPWTLPSVGAVDLLDARKPSFTPILQCMLREDSLNDDDDDGENSQGENTLEALLREQ